MRANGENDNKQGKINVREMGDKQMPCVGEDRVRDGNECRHEVARERY